MIKYLPALILLFCFNQVKSQPLISFDTVVSGLSKPVDIKEVNDSSHRLFIVEQTGKIRIWNGTSLLPSPYLDVASKITTSGGEQGLLSLAFHPNYSSNGYFYIYYTNISGDITIARYTRSSADVADSSSGVILMTIPKPFANHNGGNLVFGADGYLYFGTGDGGSAGDPNNNAQNVSSLLGKMLRIDVNNANPPYYRIPATNPFAGSTTKRPEIIASGLRNPWRWSFDKQSGDMWIGDVGQNAWEEVDCVKADSILNKNYGWHCYEGTHPYNSNCSAQSNNVFPIFEYSHNNATGGLSITGGYVYRGSEFPSLQGFYICTDYLSSNGWLIKPGDNGGWNSTMQTNWPAGISSFGERADGTLYATTLSGTLYKVVASNALPVRLASLTGRETGTKYEINWQVQNEEKGDIYIIEKRIGPSDLFTEVSRITAESEKASNNYSLKVPLTSGQTFYRLKIISVTGQVSYSNIISANGINRQMLRAFITGTILMLKLPSKTTTIELYDAAGKSVLKQETDPTSSQTNIPLTTIAKGIITIRALADNEWQVTRVLY
ncbi:PQQ-dependent sugar dehydrogenase [Segetibacter koreensis]|uniref:PQQ-dependent sugar dehydrogenase n=1 Tax=Segetibacter koreensis TaxID=398037 RepID=UPI00035FD69B|nr:PQQ-dependent sugar dehydrogenase [Segetibacter koreensis]